LKPSTKLQNHLPDGCTLPILSLLANHKVELRICKPRKTKLADYRPPTRTKPHRISINSDLNSYSFAITLLHEIAHLHVWNKYQNRVKPHGQEWKRAYKEILQPFLNQNLFPEDVSTSLEKSIENLGASSCSDEHLFRSLKNYDPKSLILDDLPDNANFLVNGTTPFSKGPLIRTRYKCRNLKNGRLYFVHKLTPVELQA
jgi:hypothetical protein